MRHELQGKPRMLMVKVPVSQCIDEVRDYILYSEMGGEVDETDPWYSTFELLEELKGKVLDEEDMSNE